MSTDWTYPEIELIISDYFSMLHKELAGLPYNKTEHRLKILPLLKNRSEGSIEFKHQNISAVITKLGGIPIKGYKPRWNYQKMLEEKVAERLSGEISSLELEFTKFTDDPILKITQPSFEKWIEERPERNLVHETAPPIFRPIKINYIQREQQNKSLGNSGEELVIQYEQWRLNREGKSGLVDKIEWISKDKGDGAGFDILSKNSNGTDRYIEVKSTKLSKDTPIYFSKTEFDFSKMHSKDYWLYRVFNIADRPKMFHLNGKFDDFCNVEALSFKGYF
jgi:hypothetical protein